ncbi:MAG: 3-ketoacyl-ACP reductase [Eubacteriaceae bacterium]
MLEKKVAIVTGAAKGIGNCIASKLAEDGFAIAIFDIIPYKEARNNIIKYSENKGVTILYYQGNLSNAVDREVFCKKVIDRFGRIDILVNNAGVAPRERKDILEVLEESYDFVMDINLKGTFFLTQYVANIMVERLKEGLKNCPKIINISSSSAYTASVNRGEYCISKAGISMITSLFAVRLAEWGINVYEIRPGIIKTDMTNAVSLKYNKKISEGLIPFRRWGYPKDIAKVVSALCSGSFDFSTGEIFNIDGGFHLRSF